MANIKDGCVCSAVQVFFGDIGWVVYWEIVSCMSNKIPAKSTIFPLRLS